MVDPGESYPPCRSGIVLFTRYPHTTTCKAGEGFRFGLGEEDEAQSSTANAGFREEISETLSAICAPLAPRVRTLTHTHAACRNANLRPDFATLPGGSTRYSLTRPDIKPKCQEAQFYKQIPAKATVNSSFILVGKRLRYWKRRGKQRYAESQFN